MNGAAPPVAHGLARTGELALTLALAALAGIAVALHVGSARMLSHVNGIYLLLADLLERGTFYPARVDVDLVYGTFYQPLSFMPLALLPGHGLGKVPAMRILHGLEALLCLALLGALAARLGLRRAACWRPVGWALCTAPVCFCLLAMRDDPRGTWLGLIALLAHVRGGPAALPVAALCLSLAFFTKLTAPFVPCVAIAFDLARTTPRAAARFVVLTVLATLVPFAILQWGLNVDLLDNALRLALLEPAFQSRDLLHAGWRLCRDVVAWPERAFGLLPLAAASILLLLLRLRRCRCDLADALALAAFAKAFLAYRNPGADYNHLFDLALFTALHVAVRATPALLAKTALPVLLALLALDRPWEELLGSARPPLCDAPAARVARALAALPRVPTLVEDPLVQLEAGTAPIVIDGGVVFGRLRGDREVRSRWFGPVTDEKALRRIVLILDPFEDSADRPGAYWYGVVNYDREFHDELRAHWRVVSKTDVATVLERAR